MGGVGVGIDSSIHSFLFMFHSFNNLSSASLQSRHSGNEDTNWKWHNPALKKLTLCVATNVATRTYKKINLRASLVAQWLRICLLMQGTRVRARVWEDPTCRGAAGPVSHNYWACASGACAPQQEATIVRGPRTAMKSGPRLPQLEKALTQKRRPNIAINQSIFKKNK